MLLAEAGYNERRHNHAVNAIQAKALTDVETIVDELAAAYCELYDFVETYEINSGMCEDFAWDLCKLLENAEAIWNDDLDDTQESAHCFTLYQNKFYDSECPEGVEDWNELPFFQRVKELLVRSKRKEPS